MQPKPFLKWAGGKTQLLPEIIKHVPDNIDRYCEPFLGGGAVFFELVNRKLIKEAILSDINWELIHTWTAVQASIDKVIVELKKKKNDKDFYYEERSKNYTMMKHEEAAARMLYLNKTCFNGLYRVNKKGKFNVPFGKYKNPNFCNEELLQNASKCLRENNVTIFCNDFENIENWVTPESFTYIDPPYIPLSTTANFTSYTSGGFSLKHQEALAALMFRFKKRGIKALLSNSDCETTRILYNGLNIFTVEAKRRINRDGTKRGKVTELLVRTW